MMQTRQTGRIHAVSDDGREFIILEYSSYTGVGELNEPRGDPSVLTYQTEECIPVHRVGEDLFEIQTDPEPTLARPRADS